MLKFLNFTLKGFIFLWIAANTLYSTAQTSLEVDALNYNLTLDTRGVFNSGLIARADILIRKKTDLNSITMQLQGFTVDSLWVNNSPASYNKTDETLSFSTPAVDTILVSIFYKGIPAKDQTWGGVYTSGTYAFNLGVGFTSNPHNFGRAWFPCFDNFVDRAFYNFNIRTPIGLKAVCNGLLVNDSNIADGTKIMQWSINQSIPTYLASFAVGKYEFIKYDFDGVNGKIPVWLAAEQKDTTHLKQSFLHLNQALQCFESKFGPYLFDRVGYTAVPFNSGAMEHAGNIAYPIYAINGNTDYETLMAHELAHHWWGNLTTCASAQDMWLNEGWASFCEALFLECVYGKQAYHNNLRQKLTDVLVNAPKNDNGYQPVSGVSHENTYGTHVYKKGALMVAALRNLMGDTAFFNASKYFLSTYKFTDVTTDLLKTSFQPFTNYNLTNFFNQYILTKGHYDIALTNITYDGRILKGDLVEIKRYKTNPSENIKTTFRLYYENGAKQSVDVVLNNGIGNLTLELINGLKPMYYTFDEQSVNALAYNIDSATLTTRGNKSFPNTLFSMNTLVVGDTAKIYILHHWVSPTTDNVREKGIRISTDRYWSIRGNFPTNYSGSGYFNYDGNTVQALDNSLFINTDMEDSLVLLYRENETKPWAVLSANVNFQPGGNIDDKLGRFWLTKLVPGDYTFGMKDQTVIGLKNYENEEMVSVFPNPAGKALTIKIGQQKLNSDLDFTCFNQAGQPMAVTYKIASNQTLELNIANLAPGNYFFTLTTSGRKYSGKFIKNK